jgi:hypothetical protein
VRVTARSSLRTQLERALTQARSQGALVYAKTPVSATTYAVCFAAELFEWIVRMEGSAPLAAADPAAVDPASDPDGQARAGLWGAAYWIYRCSAGLPSSPSLPLLAVESLLQSWEDAGRPSASTQHAPGADWAAAHLAAASRAALGPAESLASSEPAAVQPRHPRPASQPSQASPASRAFRRSLYTLLHQRGVLSTRVTDLGAAGDLWLSLPDCARLWMYAGDARKELLSILAKRPQRQMPREALEAVKLKKSPLPVQFHVSDLIGDGTLVEEFDGPMCVYVRLKR